MVIFIWMSYLLPLFQLQLMLLPLLPNQVGFLSQVCFLICLFVFILSHFLADTFVSFYLVGHSFGTFGLGIIVSRMRQYISSHGGFRFVMRNHYFGTSSRSVHFHKFLLKFVVLLTRQFPPEDTGLNGLTKCGTRIVVMQST